MTTAQEIYHAMDVSAERVRNLREQGYVIQSYHEWYRDNVYLPMITKYLANMREKGVLPKETL